jgi:hypothetical protein
MVKVISIAKICVTSPLLKALTSLLLIPCCMPHCHSTRIHKAFHIVAYLPKAITVKDLKGFWRWCVLYRTIWLLLDSIHRLVCGSFTKDHNVSETGSVSVLMWMGQDRPTQLGQSERVQWLRLTFSDGPNWVGLSCPIHLRTETDPVSETLWAFVKLPHTRQWIESKRSQIVLKNCEACRQPLLGNGSANMPVSMQRNNGVTWKLCSLRGPWGNYVTQQ